MDPIQAMPYFYLIASVSQLAAGIAMLVTNCHVRQYFMSEEGVKAVKAAIELRSCQSQTEGSHTIGVVQQGGHD